MFVLLVFVYLVVVVEMAPDQNSQFDLDSSMMAEFEADFLVLVFQVAELVEKLGLDFVQPFVDHESRSNCEFWSGAISTTTTK
jgi:hypothetical protein